MSVQLVESAILLSCAAYLAACSGPALTTASSEPGCARCAVIAENDTPFVALHAQNDTLFALDANGTIASLPKAGGDLARVVASGSGALDFGVSAAALAWVAPSDPSGTQKNRIRVFARDGSVAPDFGDFDGGAAVAVTNDAAFVGAFAGAQTGSEVIRYALAGGDATLPSETLTAEEGSELPVVAGGGAEVVWCRTHVDASSSLWRLGASGDPKKTDYPFSCKNLWSNGDGTVFVLDTSSGMNCYLRIDASGQSQMLACTGSEYAHFVTLSDGTTAFIDGGSDVRRIGSDGSMSLLFTAELLVGIESEGGGIYYAAANHLGTFAWQARPSP